MGRPKLNITKTSIGLEYDAHERIRFLYPNMSISHAVRLIVAKHLAEVAGSNVPLSVAKDVDAILSQHLLPPQQQGNTDAG